MNLDHAQKSYLTRRQFCRFTAVTTGVLAAGGLTLWEAQVGNAAPLDRGRENIQVSHDEGSFAAHAETGLAANPRLPRNLLGISIVASNKGALTLATYASFNGGSTWKSNGELPMPVGISDADDPSVAFDGAGHGFVCGSLRGDPWDTMIAVWRSDDGGASFAAPVAAMQGETVDRPYLAVDRSAGPSSGNLYVVWAAQGLTQVGLARSTNGGLSFEPTRLITKSEDIVVAGATPAVGKDGLVAVIYAAEKLSAGGNDPDSGEEGVNDDGPPSPGPAPRRPETMGEVRVLCSTDYGQTFSQPVVLGTGAIELLFPDGAAGSPALPTIAVDHHRNIIYAVFVTHESRASHSAIVLSASSDYGRTWGTTRAITPASETIIYFQPQVAVDEAGRVAISAFTFDTQTNLANVVLIISRPHNLSFLPPITVTSQPFDPARGALSGGSKHGPWWLGDYLGLASTPDAFHPLWADTRLGHLELFTATV